jgi:hypothetical protein
MIAMFLSFMAVQAFQRGANREERPTAASSLDGRRDGNATKRGSATPRRLICAAQYTKRAAKGRAGKTGREQDSRERFRIAAARGVDGDSGGRESGSEARNRPIRPPRLTLTGGAGGRTVARDGDDRACRREEQRARRRRFVR